MRDSLITNYRYILPHPLRQMHLPIKEAPWSRAAPVNDWTRCNNDSLVFAGLVGALIVFEGGLLKLSDMSVPEVEYPESVSVRGDEYCFCGVVDWLGGCWVLEVFWTPCWADSSSSSSEDKSPEENLQQKKKIVSFNTFVLFRVF